MASWLHPYPSQGPYEDSHPVHFGAEHLGNILPCCRRSPLSVRVTGHPTGINSTLGLPPLPGSTSSTLKERSQFPRETRILSLQRSNIFFAEETLDAKESYGTSCCNNINSWPPH